MESVIGRMSRVEVRQVCVGVVLAVATFMAIPVAGAAPAAPAGRTTVAPAAGEYRDYCRITASAATVRAKPRKSASAVGIAHRGDTCTAYGWAGRSGKWVKVKMKRTGVRGYVYSSLVSWGKENLGRAGR